VPRRPRVEYPGAVHHVTARGNAGRRIYRDDGDRERFLALLARVVRRRKWLCHAYCLMDNHFHLLLELPDAGLACGMQWLNATYAQGFNRTGLRSGHLFQGRYDSRLVQRERHLLVAARYVVLNPVRALLCDDPAEWMWSSYRATAGDSDSVDPVLTTDFVLSHFGGGEVASRARYRAFVADGLRQGLTP
jgi:REP element-mobilizing transposase RayT